MKTVTKIGGWGVVLHWISENTVRFLLSKHNHRFRFLWFLTSYIILIFRLFISGFLLPKVLGDICFADRILSSSSEHAYRKLIGWAWWFVVVLALSVTGRGRKEGGKLFSWYYFCNACSRISAFSFFVWLPNLFCFNGCLQLWSSCQ